MWSSTREKRAYQRSAMRAAWRVACFFLGVVIDVEVLGLQDAEIEAVVVDLVAAEVLRFGGAGGGDKRNQTHHDRHERNHGHP